MWRRENRLGENMVVTRLICYAAKYKKQLFAAFIMLALATLTELTAPVLVQIFIDHYLMPRQFVRRDITFLAVSYLSLYLFSVVMMYFQSYLFQSIAQYIIQDIRMDLFDKVQHLNLRFLDQRPVGELISRITNDTEAIKELFVRVLSVFLQNSLYLVGIFGAIFYLHVRLAMLCLILVPVILLLIYFYHRLSRKAYQLTRHKLSQINAFLNESLQGMTVIQAFRQEKRFRNQFYRLTFEHYQAHLGTVRINGLLLRPATDFIYLVVLVLVLWYFGNRSMVGGIEIGVLWAFVTYLDRFFEPVNAMMQNLASVQQALVAGERVFKLMDEKQNESTHHSQNDKGVQIRQGKVEFKNVSFSYTGEKEVLKNISFVVHPGQTVALVGHTGSGKSTIANLLLRFYPSEQGEILIDGYPLSAYSIGELRKKIGLVLQDSFLFTGTIRSNITLNDPVFGDKELEEVSRLVQADSFIERLPLKYDEPVQERGSTLSTGERQLITLARALIRDPKILIFDEATAHIDTETEEKIKTALKDVAENRTVLMIAHRLSTIEHADLILVLHQGEIVERGTHQELLAKDGLYKKMYLLQHQSQKER
jgi:ATP-binding cassette subfamily B protein